MSFDVTGAYQDTPRYWPSNEQVRDENDSERRRRERMIEARRRVAKKRKEGA